MKSKKSLNATSFSAVDWLVGGATCAMLAVVFISWTVNALFAEVDWDAGYYVSLARLVSQGCVPFLDFPSVYPPGAYYLLALAGESVLADPQLLRLLICVPHLANAALLFSLLRVLDVARLHSGLWCAVFLVWTLRSDGTDIALEPFQMTFLLAGMLALLKLRDLSGIVLAGLGIGAAVLIKQYALLLLPGFFVLVAGRESGPFENSGWTNAHALGRPIRSLEQILAPGWWKRIMVLSASAAVPYFLFALVTGQPLPENLLHLASFGGRALSDAAPGGLYQSHGFLTAISALAYGGLEIQVVLPVLVATVLLLLLRPSLMNLALMLCFVVPLAQLYVRTYPHYLQLCIPWGILIIASLASTVGGLAAKTTSDMRLGSVAVIIASLSFMGLVTEAAYEARITRLESKLSEQQKLAGAVLRILPQRTNVLVLHGPWLYWLANISPPGQEHRFIDTPDDELVQKASYVVLFPVWRYPFDQARQQLEAHGFESMASVKWRNEEVIVYRNRSDTGTVIHSVCASSFRH